MPAHRHVWIRNKRDDYDDVDEISATECFVGGKTLGAFVSKKRKAESRADEQRRRSFVFGRAEHKSFGFPGAL